jgi:hypothetical protein
MRPFNLYSFWLALYLYSMDCAACNHPTFYSSRIDGALLPHSKDD